MKQGTWIRKLLVALMMLTLCASALPALAQEAEPVTITANAESLTVNVGKTASLRLTIAPYVARKAGVTYLISDESIATVDRRGRVKGVAQGECVLTVQSKLDESVQLTIPVSVVIPVKRVKAELEKNTIFVGETTQITPTYTPDDATLKQATYSSSNEKIATVDENGVVTGVSRGRANITVRSADGNAKTALRVTVDQQPESIELTASSDSPVIGQRITIRATVLPTNANNKKVTWASLNEEAATVDKNGRVTPLEPMGVTITATSVADPSVFASIRLTNVRLAKTIAFDSKQYTVTLGETGQLSWTVGPEDTSDKAVSFKSSHPKIVSVDANGVVTALAPGKATITATTEDGSRRRAKTVVNVYVPVTGVHFNHPDIRVGARYTGSFTATIEPEKATNKNMTWTIDDESIATVTGTTNRIRVRGLQWGRCKLTGVTEDGGFTCSVYVNIGSLRRAVVVRSVDIRNGAPYLSFTNHSNMHITRVYYIITGEDEFGNPVVMSNTDGNTLHGEYTEGLEPGESTRHGHFHFSHPSDFPDLQAVSVAITGWESDTGYYGNDDALYYSYSISDGNLDWSTYESDLYLSTPK